jgi:hypothetical protein
MPYLRYYDMEREALREAYATVLNDTEMSYVFDRLQAHYGFRQRLKVYGYRGGGRCSEYRILLSHHPTVGVMAHEVAHAIQYKHGHEKGKGWHTKKHLAITRGVSELILSHLPEWRAAMSFDATERARRNGEAILAKTRRLLLEAGLGDFTQTAMQIVGAEALYGAAARPAAAASREVVLRLAIRHAKSAGAELFSKEYVGAGLSMSTGRCGLGAGRPSVSPVVRLYSFLIDKRKIDVTVRVAGELVAVSPAAATGGADVALSPASAGGELPPGRRIEVPLIRLAVARSGDKGNDANIGVIARKPGYLPAMRAALTPEAVKRYFAHFVEGEVQRFELPGIHAFNFVLHDSLGGGGTSSLRLDTQAKTYAQLLLGFPVPVPEGWSNELGV